MSKKKNRLKPTKLSKKGGSTKKTNKAVHLIMNFISMCDGKTSLVEIANLLNLPAWDLYDLIKKLKFYNLISESNL